MLFVALSLSYCPSKIPLRAFQVFLKSIRGFSPGCVCYSDLRLSSSGTMLARGSSVVPLRMPQRHFPVLVFVSVVYMRFVLVL